MPDEEEKETVKEEGEEMRAVEWELILVGVFDEGTIF